MIGFRLAERLGVHRGEPILLTTAQGRRQMRVRGIFRSGHYEKDLHQLYAPLRTAQALFGMGNQVSALAVRTEGLDAAREVSHRLQQQTGLKVRNWMDDNASLLTEIALVARITFWINVLVALATSVGIVNVFSMFVLNRQKELAILRAVGASRPSLRIILLLEAGFVWAVGAAAGLMVVLSVMAYEQRHPFRVSAETYGFDSFATRPQLAPLLTALALAGLAALAAAWWSGRRAARLNPAEVIFGR